MDNVIGLPEQEPSKLAVELSLLPLRLTPFPVVEISDGVMEEAAKYCLDNNIVVSGNFSGNIAPTFYDVNFRQEMDGWILDQTFFEYINILIKHGLLTKPEN